MLNLRLSSQLSQSAIKQLKNTHRSDDLLATTRMTEGELKQEIAIMLFQKEKLTLAQASRFTGIDRSTFQHLLASRQIPVHYGIGDFEQDIQNLREMGRL